MFRRPSWKYCLNNPCGFLNKKRDPSIKNAIGKTFKEGKGMGNDLFLKKIPIFSRVSKPELEEMSKITEMKKFKKDDLIFSEGEEGESMFLIISGLIKVFKTSTGGQIKTLDMLGKGDFLGEMAILDKEIRSATAAAIENTEVMVLKKRVFEKHIKTNPIVSLKIMQALCARLRKADKDIEALSFQNVLGRVAITLLNLAKKYGVKTENGIKINIKLTHQELADMVGTAREMVSRTLLNFKKNKCIDIDGRYIYITNMKELKELIY